MNIQYSVKSGDPARQRAACVVVGIFQNRRLSPAAQALDHASEKGLSKLLRRGDIDGSKGQSLLLHDLPGVAAPRVLLIGCGKEKALNADLYREILAHSTRVLGDTGSADAINYLSELPLKGLDHRWKLRQAVLCAADAMYRFSEMKSVKPGRVGPLRRITLTVPTRREYAAGERAIREGKAIAHGIRLTRDLANLPANVCTPSYLADQALKLGKRYASLSATVLNEAAMRGLGMGSLLSVARGAKEPPKLITLRHRGRGSSAPPVVLVGKGVTFDTGGISLKPAAAMDEMKFDMCGAASVLGTLRACAELKLPLNVVGVVPATENMPGGQATRPGDIVTSLSGRTIEILNTDAEGRLILCDALSYSERYKPSVVIDIATLTGACVIALGRHASGMLSNDPELARELLQASDNSRDRIWQLPLWEEYQQQLRSPFADVANIGGREAGVITAACFLWHFAKKYKWAHLDIAGTAWRSGERKGATGRPVGLLCQYLLERCA